MKKVSSSFVTGAIALVFAVLGYQTAVLVHYSAVARIVANRDCPDTVFVYDEGLSWPAPHPEGSPWPAPHPEGEFSGTENMADGPGKSVSSSGSAGKNMVRSNSNHGRMAQNIYTGSAGRRVETFRFDPNTVTVEDLMRLGFSEKQAMSIDNYRQKGGRYRRREDFARSYVVADSVYERLENYIDIPKLDINSADSAAFDALPGIGPYYAAKMVEYRKKLKGYSYPEQLLDLYNFDREKYDAISDLVFASRPEPYPLWSLPADSLKLHPYIGKVAVARSIVFYRTHNSPGECTVDGLLKAGIISAENAAKLQKCFIAEP